MAVRGTGRTHLLEEEVQAVYLLLWLARSLRLRGLGRERLRAPARRRGSAAGRRHGGGRPGPAPCRSVHAALKGRSRGVGWRRRVGGCGRVGNGLCVGQGCGVEALAGAALLALVRQRFHAG